MYTQHPDHPGSRALLTRAHPRDFLNVNGASACTTQLVMATAHGAAFGFVLDALCAVNVRWASVAVGQFGPLYSPPVSSLSTFPVPLPVNHKLQPYNQDLDDQAAPKICAITLTYFYGSVGAIVPSSRGKLLIAPCIFCPKLAFRIYV